MTDAQAFRPATREMRLVARLLRPLVFPVRDHALARGLRFVLVTPLAHFANLSLEFQTYLYLVFHRHPVSRGCHLLAMPLIVASLIAIVALHLGGDLAAIVLCALLTAWYLIQAVANRVVLLGGVMVVVAAACLALGIAWAELAAGSGLLWADPLLGFLVLVSVQTFSHGSEPDVPPRVSGTEDWAPISRFVLGPKGARHSLLRSVGRMGRLALAALAGAVDEIWGSPRLLPIVVLTVMWKLGYQKTRRDELEALAAAAIESGNPAIDGIGIGGGRLVPLATQETP